MKNVLLKGVLLSLSSFFVSGCSSIMTHAGPPQGYYSGSKNSVKMIKDEDTGWVMKPLLAIDLPFSALIDTVLIPYDYARSDSDPSQKSPKMRIEALESASRSQ